MSIFSKPIQSLGSEDLQALLDEKAVENVRLEFKLEPPGKDETLKKLSSFANTFGGFLVVGAKAASADGRLEALPGVEMQDGYRQKIVQWAFDGASPPLAVEVSDPIPVPGEGDRFCYVIKTLESDLTPHFLNGRKGVYVRSDEFSQRFESRLANEGEVRRLLDRRKLICERRAFLIARARRRFATFARKRYEVLVPAGEGHRQEFGALLELCVSPRYPAVPVCGQGDLDPLLRQHGVARRGGSFPWLSNVVSQHESAIVLDATNSFSIVEANIWGMLFYGTKIGKEASTASGIHLPEFIGSVLVFLRHAGSVLRALGYSGPIVVDTVLSSIRDVDWLAFPNGNSPSPLGGSGLDDEVEFSIVETADSLRENSDAVAEAVLREVFFSVNLPHLVDTPAKIRDLVAMGYKYNSWKRIEGKKLVQTDV